MQPSRSVLLVVRRVLPCALCLAASQPLLAQLDCRYDHTGNIPLIDMGTGLYQGYPGLLYPGTNERPAAHDRALAVSGDRYVMLDASGSPDPIGGKFVLISIGNSAADLEFENFMGVIDAYYQKNPHLVAVNCAQTGKNADEINDPNNDYWRHVDDHLADAGSSALQVQAVWLKESIPNPTGGFPTHALVFHDDLRTIVQIIKNRYPNTRAVYITSRIYGGYGPTGSSPEPYAYEYGFSVKWLIEEQLAGDPALNFDPAKGPVLAPWLAWGPYLWADGIIPRSDGLTWNCDEFQNDGRHVNALGKAKVSAHLLSFFDSDSTTVPWFVDCDLSKPDTFAAPPELLDDVLRKDQLGLFDLSWTSLDAYVGSDVVYDVAGGSLTELREDQGFARATCRATSVVDARFKDATGRPAPGEGTYFLVRGRDSCGAGTFGDGTPEPDPRDLLDASVCAIALP